MTNTMFLGSGFITYYAAIIPFVLLVISTCPITQSKNNIGFTVDLIHRDSPQSPFYDSSLTSSQRIVNLLRRSFNRHNRQYPTPETDITISKGNGEFLMKYYIGSPPVPTLGIADTGSEITWTQCQPCSQCFEQSLPFFSPKKSSTYRNIPCDTTLCTNYNQTHCSTTSRNKNCLYSEKYGDGAFTNGEIFEDTLTLGSTTGGKILFPNITFGCGFNNSGNFAGGESGIVGLGAGKNSLVSQLGRSIGGKFSYCLVPYSESANISSKLNFGANAEVSGQGAVSTPLTLRKYYYLTLEGISVGNQRFDWDDGKGSKAFPEGSGNILIDSGTTLTYLPQNLYDKVEKAVKSTIVGLKVVSDPEDLMRLCYFTRTDIQKIDFTLHFKGADVELKPDNVFIRVNKTVLCLAVSVDNEFPTYGNVAQTNFLVGYDRQRMIVSLKAADCSSKL